MRDRPMTTPSATGKAPPERDVPAPLGMILTPMEEQRSRTAETCAAVFGSTTAIGFWR